MIQRNVITVGPPPGLAEAVAEIENEKGGRNYLNLKSAIQGDQWTMNPQDYQRDPWLMEGLLRKREVMNFVADSKAYKTFTVMAMHLCFLTGRSFMGKYIGAGGRSFAIDNELKTASFRTRFIEVAGAIEITKSEAVDLLNDRFKFICFRDAPGGVPDINTPRKMLSDFGPDEFDFLSLDSLYRFWPKGMSENDNAAITQVYNTLTDITASLDGGMVATVHTSSGSQADKKNTDIGSGGKAMSRAADVHATMLAHQKDGYAVFQANLRDARSIDAETIFMQSPGWWQPSDLTPEVKTQLHHATAKAIPKYKAILDGVREVFMNTTFYSSQIKSAQFSTDVRHCHKVCEYGVDSGVLIEAGTMENSKGEHVKAYKFKG